MKSGPDYITALLMAGNLRSGAEESEYDRGMYELIAMMYESQLDPCGNLEVNSGIIRHHIEAIFDKRDSF